MQSLVNAQICLPCKAFGTDIAGVALFNVVPQPLVRNQRRLRGEAGLTDATHEGLFTRVQPLVDSEAHLNGKVFVTHTAHKGPLCRVRPHVNAEAVTASVALRADVAGVRPLASVRSFMDVQV